MSLEILWFCLVAAMLAAYVVLDGYDLGAGIVHLWLARTDDERRAILRSIGPLWDGNEVWLIAAGGTIYFAFPALYARSLSGFYLPLMIVLWLLILRGLSIEFRSHFAGPVWRPFWDVVFAGASTLLALFLGVALGNVVRGVPIDATGSFFVPLWTDLGIGRSAGILDWFTVTVGVTALAALAAHGAIWVAMRTEGGLAERARRLASRVSWIVVALTALVTALTLAVQQQVLASLGARPWGAVFPLFAVAGLAAVRLGLRRRDERRALLGSSAYLASMIASAAFGLYPYVLPALGDSTRSLTARAAAASDYGLEVGLLWWIPGMILAAAYSVIAHRLFAGKVRLDRESD